MKLYLAGAVSGFLATAPMTLAMELMHRRLPWRERYALPPREITMNLADAAGVKKHLPEEGRFAATMTGHFGYGTLVGALYAPLARKVKAPVPVKGALFGMLVWTVSYLGILPLVHVLPPATRQPQRRNALMIASHLVWGISLALLNEMLNPAGEPDKDYSADDAT
jgi:putative membrane protein